MRKLLLILVILAFAGILFGQDIPEPDTASCSGCGAMSYRNADGSWTDIKHKPGCPYYNKIRGAASTGIRVSKSCPPRESPEMQLTKNIFKFLLNSIFMPKPAAPPSDKANQLSAVRQQLAEDRENQHQLKLQQEQELAQQKMFANENNRLIETFKGIDSGTSGVIGASLPSSELKFKTIGTDFFGVGKPTEIVLQPSDTGRHPASDFSDEFIENQRKLIRQRLEEPNNWCSALYASLKTNAPPPPDKKWNEMQPGDVLLLDGQLIAAADNLISSGSNVSSASHTVSFLQEINGKKHFLDNQPGVGPTIITEDEFHKLYSQRGIELAKLAQPLNEKEAKLLFAAAVEMAQKNRKTIAKNFFGSPIFGTSYGVGNGNVVCSEADWALIHATGRDLPKSIDPRKADLFIKISPADYKNSQYFLVTRLDIVPSYSTEEK